MAMTPNSVAARTGTARELRQTWGTPLDLFVRLYAEYQFDLDVCALPWNAMLPAYYTPAVDGLRQLWAARNWCNPPYLATRVWLVKAWEQACEGRFTCCLVPASVGTGWWHELVAERAEIHWVRGRLKYRSPLGADGRQQSAMFDSALVLIGGAAVPGRQRCRDRRGEYLC